MSNPENYAILLRMQAKLDAQQAIPTASNTSQLLHSRNLSESESALDGAPFLQHLSLVIYCLISIVSIIGNATFCLVIWRTEKLRTVSHLLMTNLGLANLTFSVLSTPYFIWTFILKKEWVWGLVLCKLSSSVLHFTATVSFYAIALVAIDRWLSVFRPTLRFSKKVSVVFTGAIWAIAIAVTAPYLYLFTLEDQTLRYNSIYMNMSSVTGKMNGAPKWRCLLKCELEKCKLGLEVSTVVIQYCLPVLVTIPAYAHLCCFLCLKREVGSELRQKRAEARKRKVILFLVLIVGSFVGCWSPYFITFILQMANLIKRNYTAFIWLFILASTGVALTPLLYLANDTFRVEILSLCLKLGCQCLGSGDELEAKRRNKDPDTIAMTRTHHYALKNSLHAKTVGSRESGDCSSPEGDQPLLMSPPLNRELSE